MNRNYCESYEVCLQPQGGNSSRAQCKEDVRRPSNLYDEKKSLSILKTGQIIKKILY